MQRLWPFLVEIRDGKNEVERNLGEAGSPSSIARNLKIESIVFRDGKRKVFARFVSLISK